jgi:hypothetical protein
MCLGLKLLNSVEKFSNFSCGRCQCSRLTRAMKEDSDSDSDMNFRDLKGGGDSDEPLFNLNLNLKLNLKCKLLVQPLASDSESAP